MKLDIGEEEPIEVDEIGFDTVSEEWNEYELDDGTTLKIKLVVKKVLRAKNAYNESGEPLYNVASTNIVSTSNVPEELMEYYEEEESDEESNGE